MFHEGPISEVESYGTVEKTRSYTLWCEAHDPVSATQCISIMTHSVLKSNPDKPRAKEPIETGPCLPWPHLKPGMEIVIKYRGRDEEGVPRTVISNDVAGRRVECQERTGYVRTLKLERNSSVFSVIYRTRWYCWSQVLGIPGESEEISGSEPGADDL